MLLKRPEHENRPEKEEKFSLKNPVDQAIIIFIPIVLLVVALIIFLIIYFGGFATYGSSVSSSLGGSL